MTKMMCWIGVAGLAALTVRESCWSYAWTPALRLVIPIIIAINTATVTRMIFLLI
jgi:hypothetical protein